MIANLDLFNVLNNLTNYNSNNSKEAFGGGKKADTTFLIELSAFATCCAGYDNDMSETINDEVDKLDTEHLQKENEHYSTVRTNYFKIRLFGTFSSKP